jgi:alpha-N-arabinofuranosidase
MDTLTLRTGRPGPTIEAAVYGHFAEHLGRCIYEGLWVGEDSTIPNTKGLRNDVVAALRSLKVPVLRWPGGCFADEYHWKDGVGPREQRKRMVNTHWGGLVEDNAFGTHEFLELCDQLGCEPYINGNVGSGTVQEMSEWVEYLTFDGDSPMARLRASHGRDKPWKVKFFGVGNESWGCGGNMRPEMYADVYRRYQTFVRNYGDNKIHRIACGANVDDYRWTEVLMKEAGRFMDALTLHHYAWGPGPEWLNKGPATGFPEGEWSIILKNALRMDELITRHKAIMDQHDPDKRIGMIVDEWGAWYRVEKGTNPGFLYQQNTIRDALVAGITLNIFHKHADRVRMANLAQMVNVLQAVILTDKNKMLLTPTYHVLRMYQGHQGARVLDLDLDAGTLGGDTNLPRFSASASVDSSGTVRISVCHLGPASAGLSLSLPPETRGLKLSAEVLSGPEMDSHNTFDAPTTVTPAGFNAYRATGTGLELTLPPRSVTVLTWRP